MATSADIFDTAITAARDAANLIPESLSSVKALDDQGLLRTQRSLAELRRLVDARSSLIAGEVAFRSRRDLGYTGLAQREGFQTAEKLVQDATGSTAREATTLVAVGTMVHETMVQETMAQSPDDEPGGDTGRVLDPVTGEVLEAFPVREPWLAEVGAAVATGTLTVEAARAIKSGLGAPSVDAGGVGVSADDLATAAARLLESAAGLNADRLFKLARQLRDELDVAGVAVREQLIYEQRAFRRTKRANGLPRFVWEPDLETSVYLDSVYDGLLAPRRGGPRFVDPAEKAWADEVAADPRTNDQYLNDAFAGLLRLGVDTDRAERQYYHRLTGTAERTKAGGTSDRLATEGTGSPATAGDTAGGVATRGAAGEAVAGDADGGAMTGGTGIGVSTGGAAGGDTTRDAAGGDTTRDAAGGTAAGDITDPVATDGTSGTFTTDGTADRTAVGDAAASAAAGGGATCTEPPARRTFIVGSRTPAVRVLVTERALCTGVGAGHFEGSDIPVSIDTVNRIVCDSGILPIRFTETDDVVALGRQERLFTGRQRIALAARDGGCMWPGCDRPPGWTEAHHITPWQQGGKTDLCDGVLLCRHHHMLLHNNHWEITRRGSTYWLTPPPDVDPTRTPRQLHSKSPAVGDLQRERRRPDRDPAARAQVAEPVEPALVS